MKKVFSSFVAIGALLAVHAGSARMITVVITSENQHKVAAVKKVFQQKFSHDAVACIACKVPSNVSEQPIGINEATMGARSRLSGIPQGLSVSADYLVSIESYIEQSPITGAWSDRGLVVVKDMRTQQELSAISRPVYIAERFVQFAREHACTVGQAIQSIFAPEAIDPHDWHRHPEFGGVARAQLLEDALFKVLHEPEITFLRNQLVFYPDFPKPGILFADFFPILSNPEAFQVCINLLAERYATRNITAIIGLESRGFLAGAALAYKLGVRFVPVRKPGKLPMPTHAVSYQKEYGSDTLVISKTALQPSDRVLIIDDLIATGGSARAAIELVKLAGATPVEFSTLLRIEALEEQAKLSIAAFNLID